MSLFKSLFKSGADSKKANCKAGISPKSGTAKNKNFSEEFSIDTPLDFHNSDIVSCSQSGVLFVNIPNMLKLAYNGILAESGAKKLYAVIGYGDNNNWEEIETFPMQKTAQDNFELLVYRKKQGNVNVAFKDEAENWDNNNGANFIFYDDTK